MKNRCSQLDTAHQPPLPAIFSPSLPTAWTHTQTQSQGLTINTHTCEGTSTHRCANENATISKFHTFASVKRSHVGNAVALIFQLFLLASSGTERRENGKFVCCLSSFRYREKKLKIHKCVSCSFRRTVLRFAKISKSAIKSQILTTSSYLNYSIHIYLKYHIIVAQHTYFSLVGFCLLSFFRISSNDDPFKIFMAQDPSFNVKSLL